jgi:signal transduction histidine kinase
MHSREPADAPPRTVGARPAAIVALIGLALLTAVTRAAWFSGSVEPAAILQCLGGASVAGFVTYLAIERQRRLLGADLQRLVARNDELRAAAVRKDEFLASVSHELRTPLNVVLGYVDLLLDHSFGPLEPGQRDILHRITKNASNLSHLINDLLDLSRIDAGRLAVEMGTVPLKPLFADLGAVMDVLLAGHDVTFAAEIATPCTAVRADPHRLKQVVSNLLVNAVKFTERGAITLRAESAAADRVVVSVADTGIGIPLPEQHAIFEPFRQVHDRERRAPGAGIGLSISARLATLMGGELGVTSEPGKGSRFALVLDAAPAERPPATPALRKVS